MAKIPTLFPLAVPAAPAEARSGAGHNQLSNGVGPACFTEFRFLRFRVPAGPPPRLGATDAIVAASWWRGPQIAGALFFGRCTVPAARTRPAAGMGAIVLAVLSAAFGAPAGLIGRRAADVKGLIDPVPAGDDSAATRSDFIRAGFMHNAGNVGGKLGLIAAFFPMRRARIIDLEQPARESANAAT